MPPLSAQRFRTILQYSLCLKKYGICVTGPPCSLFSFLSQSVHRREKDSPEGDCRNHKVVMSNILVTNLSVILAIMMVRSVLIVVEQPQNSKLWFHWALSRIIHPSNGFRRVWTWMRCFGHELPKPSILVANFCTINQMRRVWSLRREVASLEIGSEAWSSTVDVSALGRYTVTHADKLNNAAYHIKNPNGKVQGTKKLSTAAAYTVPFAREIFRYRVTFPAL